MTKENNKIISGEVVSVIDKKSVVVSILRYKKRGIYNKLIKINKKLNADTNGLVVKKEDTVELIGSKPISKHKRYKLLKIIGK